MVGVAPELVSRRIRDDKSVVPLVGRAVGNLQQWLIGTDHGVSRAQRVLVALELLLFIGPDSRFRCGEAVLAGVLG